jgi:hypothetical protein
MGPAMPQPAVHKNFAAGNVDSSQGVVEGRRKRGDLPLEGEVLHTIKFPSTINRDPSPYSKTQNRRTLKKRSAATIIVRK